MGESISFDEKQEELKKKLEDLAEEIEKQEEKGGEK